MQLFCDATCPFSYNMIGARHMNTTGDNLWKVNLLIPERGLDVCREGITF
jgi:hypothetical protein